MRILIVKLAAIGDVVMTLPLLNYLRCTYPTCHITWICGQQVKSLLEATGQIDQIICVKEADLYLGGFWLRMLTLAQIWWHIVARQYDLCITAHPDPRYRWITFPAICKERRSCQRFEKRSNPIPGRYHAREYLRLITKEATPPISHLVTETWPSQSEIPLFSFPQMTLPTHFCLSEQISRLDDRPIIVLAPGGAKNILNEQSLRRWPIEFYVSLIQKLSKIPARIIITGGSSDLWLKEYLKELSCTDLIGKLELLELVALFKQCHLLITHDSGPLHLAKLVRCPTIALFGPTNPLERVDTAGAETHIKVICNQTPLPCQPCYDGKTFANCKNNLCLRLISPDQVFNEAIKRFNLNENINHVRVNGIWQKNIIWHC